MLISFKLAIITGNTSHTDNKHHSPFTFTLRTPNVWIGHHCMETDSAVFTSRKAGQRHQCMKHSDVLYLLSSQIIILFQYIRGDMLRIWKDINNNKSQL